MKEVSVTIRNKQGVHARPSQKIAELASKYNSSVTLINDGIEADAKSLISLMMLAAVEGSVITIKADGEDENEVIDALVKLIEVDKFGED